jgi:N-acetylglucosamine-6-phosphate deacetylase
MKDVTIAHVAVIGLDDVSYDCTVRCRDGRIVGIGPAQQFQPAPDEPLVDGAGCFLAPGFIDLHTHGLLTHLVDRGPGDVAGMSKALPRFGVTGFLPTVCPKSEGEDADHIQALAEAVSGGAAILGFHIEGPYMAVRGGLPEIATGKADPRRVQRLIDAAKPYRAVFSVSPEYPGIIDALLVMTQDGAPAFITHTAAGVEETEAAIAAGACHATHFYDAFPVPPETDAGVRPCGTVEAILADPDASVDFILDGVHVDPVAARMAWRCKGPDRLCLITDANVGTGLPPGRYEFLGGIEVSFSEPGGPARMTEKSHHPGALAGSGLTMDRAVRNAAAWLGLELPETIRLASANPARVLGLQDRKGRVARGYDADLVLLDENLHVRRTWVGGECRYNANA